MIWKRLLSTWLWLVMVIVLSLVQLIIVPLFPWPLRYLPVISSIVIWQSLVFRSRSVFWFTLVAGYILGAFSILPFGTLILALAASAAITSWLINSIFTNRSVFMVMLVGGLGSATYIGIISLAVMFSKLLSPQSALHLNTTPLVSQWLLSLALVAGGYRMAIFWIRRLNPRYVSQPEKIV